MPPSSWITTIPKLYKDLEGCRLSGWRGFCPRAAAEITGPIPDPDLIQGAPG
jgi:hypothetical protein